MQNNKSLEIVVEQTLDIDSWKETIKKMEQECIVSVYNELDLDYRTAKTIKGKKSYYISIVCYLKDFYLLLPFLRERNNRDDIIAVSQAIDELQDEIESSDEEESEKN